MIRAKANRGTKTTAARFVRFWASTNKRRLGNGAWVSQHREQPNARGVQQMVLGDAMSAAPPPAADGAVDARRREQDEPHSSTSHIASPSSTASSARAESSAFEMNPRAPLRSIPPP